MNVADLVMILLIANAVQNAMVGPDVSLAGGLIAAVVLLVVNFLVTRALSRSREAQKLLAGLPKQSKATATRLVPSTVRSRDPKAR